jgi:hypothetical protein
MTKIERWSYNLDTMRLIPRVVMGAVTVFAGHVGFWFMALPAPTAEQSAFASIVSAAYVKALDWYMANGIDWDKRRKTNASVE